MGQFPGASKPSIIMNCNCICTVFPLIASAYIQYTYTTKFSVQLSYARGFSSPHPPKKNLVSWAFVGGLSGDDRAKGLREVVLGKSRPGRGMSICTGLGFVTWG